MSTLLESLIGAARREECERNDRSEDFWRTLNEREAQRRVQKKPLTPFVAIRATGNHRAAANDEPEPTFAAIHEAAQQDAQDILRGKQQ